MPEPVAPPVSSESVIRFGRHRGQPIAALDDGYLTWLLGLDGMWDDTAAALRWEWRRRAGHRRSWRPVVRAKWGRRVFGVWGQGPFAVVQPCGGWGWWTIELSPTLDEARAKRRADCGYDGGSWGCQAALHFVYSLLDMTEDPGEANGVMEPKGRLGP